MFRRRFNYRFAANWLWIELILLGRRSVACYKLRSVSDAKSNGDRFKSVVSIDMLLMYILMCVER